MLCCALQQSTALCTMRLCHKIFVALVLFSSIPLLILLFGVVERVEGEVMQRRSSELYANLDRMAGELNMLLTSQKSLTHGLAQVPAVTEFTQALSHGDPSLIRQRAQQLERFFLNYSLAVSSIQALRYLDSDGKTLVKVREGQPIEARLYDPDNSRFYVGDQSGKSFYQMAMSGRDEIMMSDFEMGQVTDDADFCPAMLRYSVRLHDELGRPRGLVVMNMWGTRVDDLAQASLGTYPGQAYIVELNPGTERDGIYLYHERTERRFADQTGRDYRFAATVSPAAWESMQNAQGPGMLLEDSGRMLFYRSFTPYLDRSVRWLLVIETDAETLLAPIENLRRSIWVLLGGLLLVGLLVAGWAAARLSRPAQALTEVISRYAQGNSHTRYTEARADDIGNAGRAFNRLADSLERAKLEREKAELAVRQSERLAAVGQLAAGIGHEINNPLMNMMSLAALVEQSIDPDDEQSLADLRLLQQEGHRCARIVQGILNFARRNQPSYSRFDMVALVEATLALLQHRSEAASIEMQCEFPPSLSMEGDPGLLQQVLVNILLNAIQASPPDAVIMLRAQQRDDRVCLEIIDQGPGIDERHRVQVFNPFFTTKPEGEGTGLGLSVSYGIVKEHGGDITTENLPGAGLRVAITLPRRRPAQRDNPPKALESADVL